MCVISYEGMKVYALDLLFRSTFLFNIIHAAFTLYNYVAINRRKTHLKHFGLERLEPWLSILAYFYLWLWISYNVEE